MFSQSTILIYIRKYLNSYVKHIHIQMIIFNLIIYIFLYPYLFISFLQRGFTDYPSRPKYLAPRNALRLDSIYFDEPLWKPFDDKFSFRRNFVDGTFERSVENWLFFPRLYLIYFSFRGIALCCNLLFRWEKRIQVRIRKSN